jgi:hypothetical protein
MALKPKSFEAIFLILPPQYKTLFHIKFKQK